MQSAQVQRSATLLASASSIACLTGAGVSAESGVPTFRDAQTGLWSRYDPETLASPAGFARHPGRVWRWYMWRLALVEPAEPNPGHVALAELERRLDHFTLITQNVDHLHEAAGSRNVLHLHGELARFRCHGCGRPYPLETGDRERETPPACPHCGGFVRPDVVWFGEMLPRCTLEAALEAVHGCDVLLVVGTSGLVHPAAQLPAMARESGARIIDVNPRPDLFAQGADIYLQGKSGVVLPRLLEAVVAVTGDSASNRTDSS